MRGLLSNASLVLVAGVAAVLCVVAQLPTTSAFGSLRPPRLSPDFALHPLVDRQHLPMHPPTAQAPFCNTSVIPFLGCQMSCHYCLSDPTSPSYTANVTCTDLGSSQSASASGVGNASQTVLEAIAGVTLKLSANFTHNDCTCTTQGDLPVLSTCTVRTKLCAYIPSVDPTQSLIALVRGEVWDMAEPSRSARSRGWSDPAQGYAPPDELTMFSDTVGLLRSKAPPSSGCAPQQLPPLVIVPGLTSSMLEMNFTDLPRPHGEFWCNASTHGWQTLWPAAAALATEPAQLACWVADMEVVYDPPSKTFGPQRKGLQTRLVDFGSFDGIPGFGGVLAMWEAAGWTKGRDFFAAPFDWRLPSSAQAEFFDQLKALVERASASNGNRKVVLWAFSFGPQYTLSFLHRMSQAWKDQYIDTFVATSPVWSGSPTALIAYVSGYETPKPPSPPQCKAFTLYEATCFAGGAGTVINNTDLAGCCQAAAANSSTPGSPFNFFNDTGSCQLVTNYASTEPCNGILGYLTQPHTEAAPAQQAQTAQGQLGDIPLTPALTRVLSRALPSLMWAFPRAGKNATYSWTDSEPLIITPKKNYTAFEVKQLLQDLGRDEVAQAQLAFLETEPDLGAFASPGVPTFVTYGYGITTFTNAHYAEDLTRLPPGTPSQLDAESGDGIVPLRSSLRGQALWAGDAQHPLYHKGYKNQPHAACMLLGDSTAQTCWSDVMAVLVARKPPSLK